MMISPKKKELYIKAKYTGETFLEKPHGIGSFQISDGTSGTGYFKNGQLHGVAAIHHKDGWTGSYTFKNGVRDGLSKWYYPKGRKGFVNNKNFKDDISGQAMIVSLIKDEAREGLGYSYDNDTGKIFAGLWSKNKIKSGITSYLKDNNTESTSLPLTISSQFSKMPPPNSNNSKLMLPTALQLLSRFMRPFLETTATS